MPILGIAGDVVDRKKSPRRSPQQIADRQARRRAKKLRNRALLEAKAQWGVHGLFRGEVSNATVVGRNEDGHGRLRTFQLYALRLEGDKYYVGMTAFWDAQKRFDQHASGTGAKWTALYRPVEIVETRQLGEVYESQAADLETEMTIEYMLEYGTDRVRGGDMCYLNGKKVDEIFRRHIRRKLTEREVAS